MLRASEAVPIARRAAIHAAKVYKAVIKGPQAPAPAAWGVELSEFQKALPWLQWRELVAFAMHFGRHGNVREDLAVELARELGKRLAPPVASELSHATFTQRSPQEVSAVTYAFSKLAPQKPGYSSIYDAVALGIIRGAWRFSTLQSAHIGAALADADAHLADVLPAVVRPVIQRIEHDADAHAALTADELRYLLHACVKIPGPGLMANETEVLANSTKRLIGSTNFPVAAHLTVSWLQIIPPAEAKKAHQDALRVACLQLSKEVPKNPAHPLPAAGLAPAVASLLARESEYSPPPLTPPKLRGIVGGLVLISKGLRSEAAIKGRKSLNLSDWTEIAWLVAEFCELHEGRTDIGSDDLDAKSVASQAGSKQRPLSGWVGAMLGYIFSHPDHLYAGRSAPADLDTVLSLLRLLQRYKPWGTPPPRFFVWAAKRIEDHHQAGSVDAAAFAEAVSHVVPRLPSVERERFTRVLLAGAATPVSSYVSRVQALQPVHSDETLPASPAPVQRPRLLIGAVPAASETISTSAVTVAATSPSVLSSHTLPAGRSTPRRPRLWDLLSESTVKTDSLNRDSSEISSVLGNTAADSSAAKNLDEVVIASADVSQVIAATIAKAPESVAEPAVEPATGDFTPTIASTSTPAEPLHRMDELQAKLERALQRVEALEARLEETEQRQAVQHMPGEKLGCSEQTGPSFGAWEPDDLFSDTVMGTSKKQTLPGMNGVKSVSEKAQEHVSMQHAGAAAAPLYFHRPFVFEEFRRANSSRLQNERLRVLVPPDHFPTWPLMAHKK